MQTVYAVAITLVILLVYFVKVDLPLIKSVNELKQGQVSCAEKGVIRYNE